MNGRIVFAALLMAFIATPLCAQFVRLEVDQVKAHTEGDLAGFNTYRVYAVLAEEGNVIDAVYGEKNAPLTSIFAFSLVLFASLALKSESTFLIGTCKRPIVFSALNKGANRNLFSIHLLVNHAIG